MIYLSQMLGNPVLDANGEKIGVVNDLGIATREVFPRVTSLAFQGPGKTPFMISWRKYVETFDDNEVRLAVPATDIRFSYLQPDEVLIARDLLNKQIVDTRGMRVVRVNDLKLSETSQSQLRLLGAEVGARGILRALSPTLERLALRAADALGQKLPERIIAWNYMDLIDRDLSNVKLSVSHQTLDNLHPADVADIIEQLDPRLRGQVFAQLDDAQAAEAMAELDDDEMAAKIVGDMADADASRMLSEMDPDDAAELVSELDYERAEKLLRLMGIKEQRAVRQLLGYRENTAGRIMTSEFVAMPRDATVADAQARMRELPQDFEPVHYIYLTDDAGKLLGVVSVRRLFISEPADTLGKLAGDDDVLSVRPDDDQEDVAEDIAKYNLLAMPVADEKTGKLLGIVTVDDALDVLEEEHEEDLQIAGVSSGENTTGESAHALRWFAQRQYWILVWALAACAIAALVVPHASDILVPASPIDDPVASSQDIVTGYAKRALMPICVLPLVLLAAMRMTAFVKVSFLEHDERDDKQRPYLGFFLKMSFVGLLLGTVVVLLGQLVSGCLFGEGDPETREMLLACFFAAGAVIAGSYASAVVYLKMLFWRDEHDLATSGAALTFAALVIAAAAYTVLGTLPVR